VEIAGFRSNTAPKLIDVADYFIDLGDIADKVRKEISHGTRYDERELHEPLPAPYMDEPCQLPQPAEGFQATMRVALETDIDEDAAEFEAATEFIRITDDH
jgi:hypothetical protein